MDVVVSGIPPKFGMLLSRSWAAKLKGTLQMDISYATIPFFGQERRIYKEVLLNYMVSNKRKPNNHPIYSIDIEVGSSIFYVIPKGLVPLENIFDNNDVAKNHKIIANEEEIEDCNIGTKEDPKIIKLSKKLNPEVKERYIKLMKDFPDVFAWSYKDLKVYDAKVIEHVILVKNDQNPFN
jgi:hypothetical protein